MYTEEKKQELQLQHNNFITRLNENAFLVGKIKVKLAEFISS